MKRSLLVTAVLLCPLPGWAATTTYTGNWGVEGIAEPLTRHITALAQQPWLHGSMVKETFQIKEMPNGQIEGRAFYGIDQINAPLTGGVSENGNLFAEADIYQGRRYVGTFTYIGHLSAQDSNLIEGVAVTAGIDPDVHTNATTLWLRNLAAWMFALNSRIRDFEDRAHEIHVAKLNLIRRKDGK